mmetsp:Transcript_16908/g.22336  ORF Transcript_16908/g.22336 Transcript_16908/m.22336 type:complete len:110 (-) Transcript_16908:468-797(-)|eukprot:CAMPEP_0117774258 /NCGR_PEP_ID=MMETSP0947-20121206/26399_1 /TAXON_ID=44440 /ORGANISM="Chattonella subsalsa, Strain CCMP2191" /LENGTH=109 /DNA_ID=CAMNT_0005600667 /DNA_START=114 /DNA_END=443 /DNA_ORIENTATION=+
MAENEALTPKRMKTVNASGQNVNEDSTFCPSEVIISLFDVLKEADPTFLEQNGVVSDPNSLLHVRNTLLRAFDELSVSLGKKQEDLIAAQIQIIQLIQDKSDLRIKFVI